MCTTPLWISLMLLTRNSSLYPIFLFYKLGKWGEWIMSYSLQLLGFHLHNCYTVCVHICKVCNSLGLLNKLGIHSQLLRVFLISTLELILLFVITIIFHFFYLNLDISLYFLESQLMELDLNFQIPLCLDHFLLLNFFKLLFIIHFHYHLYYLLHDWLIFVYFCYLFLLQIQSYFISQNYFNN